jgi:hypothetical protein
VLCSGHAVKAHYRAPRAERILLDMSNRDADAGTRPLLIVNARVWTNDPRRRWADAVLVRDARVFAVGSSAELRKRAGAGTVIVDARGWLVLPARSDAILEHGAPASLLIADRTTGAEPPSPADQSAVVFALADGAIVLDHRALAR